MIPGTVFKKKVTCFSSVCCNRAAIVHEEQQTTTIRASIFINVSILTVTGDRQKEKILLEKSFLPRVQQKPI